MASDVERLGPTAALLTQSALVANPTANPELVVATFDRLLKQLLALEQRDSLSNPPAKNIYDNL